jgi:hypothetical protein
MKERMRISPGTSCQKYESYERLRGARGVNNTIQTLIDALIDTAMRRAIKAFLLSQVNISITN